jgi:hypothetical protein
MSNYCVANGSGPLSNLVFLYLDIGSLSPTDADAFVAKTLEKWKPVTDRLPEDVGFMVVPIRPGSTTRIETLPIVK